MCSWSTIWLLIEHLLFQYVSIFFCFDYYSLLTFSSTICLFVCMCVCLYVCVYLSVCLSDCLHEYLGISLLSLLLWDWHLIHPPLRILLFTLSFISLEFILFQLALFFISFYISICLPIFSYNSLSTCVICLFDDFLLLLSTFFSIIIWSLQHRLGLMRANYHSLPPRAIDALEFHYDR